MKALAVLTVAVMAAVFVPAKAAASSGGPLILNVSGTIVLQADDGTNHTTTKTNIYTTSTMSFNEKYIYNMISNAVASTNYIYLPPQNLPSDGYIVFSPTNSAINQNVYEADYYSQGLFYVTNKEGYSFNLNGYDTNGDYYSYIELDNDDCGFYNNLYGEYSGSEPVKTGIGTYTETEASILYVHDNPYAFDDADQPSELFDNANAIEIRSTMKASWQGVGGDNALNNTSDVSTGSGTGSAKIDYNDGATLSSGHVSLLP